MELRQDAASLFRWHHGDATALKEVAREGGEKNVPAEENKAVFRRYIEEDQHQGNLAVADEIFDRYISHQSDGSTLERGPEDVKRFTEEYRSAFPDWRISIDEQIAEGDKVVNRVTLRGTHQRQFRDMAPTGKEVEVRAVTIFRFSEEGKVVETWDYFDQLRLVRLSIVQELRVARSIQEASLPKEVPTLEGWVISPRYQPAREVGGDFYDFHFLSEGRLGLVVGDATGKGVPAALVMSTTCRQSPKPWIPLRLGRYSLGSTRRCFYASLPTCWSPA